MPVLKQYCDKVDFESIHNLCIGKNHSMQVRKEYSERLIRPSESELGLTTDTSLVEPTQKACASKKSSINDLRRKKIRQTYVLLNKLCKLSRLSTDEEISKRVCLLVSRNKVGMLADGEIYFSMKTMISEKNQSDLLLNEGDVRQGSDGVANTEHVTDDEKDKEVSVDVSVEMRSQFSRRKSALGKKSRNKINEYLEIIKDNIPWLDPDRKTEKFWVLYNACLYMKMVDSKVGVEYCPSQPGQIKTSHVKMTASTTQEKGLDKTAVSTQKPVHKAISRSAA
ncbi:hypothetical protein GCM10023116_04090 [Kistimonas scapharcae]|uniref:BHLH domain-containing protein n=1 Tax=Kistimonas scapharcae TaxID=1036133 RepID=A0ABP8UYH4_9GAMM